MSYRILLVLIVFVFFVNITIAEIGRFFPKFLNIENFSSVFFWVNFLFLLLIIIFFIFFQIEKKINPKDYIVPIDNNQVEKNARELGIFALVKEVFSKDKNLLLVSRDKRAHEVIKEDAKNSIKAMKIMAFSLVALFLLIFIIYFFLLNLQANNQIAYKKITTILNKFSQTSVYQFFEKDNRYR